MLVYANHLTVEGAGAEAAVLKAVGGWLKEQLGYGLHPEQLRQDGEFEGRRGEQRSRLRVRATQEGEPALYAWVLRHAGEDRGRQWITELGMKKAGGLVQLSCVVKTDEHSTLVTNAVTASQPRVVRYLVRNIAKAKDADFSHSVPGEVLRSVGEDRDSYRALLADIERQDRKGPLVLVSPTSEGEYLLNVPELQETLIGLAQVVKITHPYDSYEMAEVLGRSRAAWGGAVNILFVPNAAGIVRSRLFLSDAIREWGEDGHARISRVLAWVTDNTNIRHLHEHIRPEGVSQLALRRRMNAIRERSVQMDAGQLRRALEDAAKREAEQADFFDGIVAENAALETNLSRLNSDLKDALDEGRKKDFEITSLKAQLSQPGTARSSALDPQALVQLASRAAGPTPLECIELIEKLFGDRCVVLESARTSAERSANFVYGRQLLDLLARLVTTYREALMSGGDAKARDVFGKNQYAAKESETVMANKAMRRQRTFEYDGGNVEMFRHLKIGADDDVTKTIRVHFHWDGARERIVIGYCGEHLAVVSH